MTETNNPFRYRGVKYLVFFHLVLYPKLIAIRVRAYVCRVFLENNHNEMDERLEAPRRKPPKHYPKSHVVRSRIEE